jgi:hypothetical protein
MKKFLCVALAMMLVLSLAACGSSNEVGKYYFESMEAEGMSFGREYFTAMGMTEEQLDEYLFIEIKEPGKAVMISAGETAEVAYDGTSIWPVEEPDEKANCTIADGKITVEAEGATMVFVKK